MKEGQGGGRRRAKWQGQGTAKAVLTVLLKACTWCERRGADVGKKGLWTGFFMGIVYENRQEICDTCGQMGAGDRTMGKGHMVDRSLNKT